ncbi:signal protein [Rhodoferax sp.]|uniref:signal protein n=1 Tax=Rhodoferax sp. TaxID=50421 RepID=UPI003454E355
MKSNIRALAIALGMCFAGVGFAATAVPAATASAPAAMAPAAAPVVVAPAATPAAKPAAAAPAAKKAATAMPTVAAAGGGDGKVWVNEKSKTYHCEGTKFYGKTKTGEYMAEADAKAKGNHPSGGKACAK